MVRNEEFDDMGTNEVDGYGGVTENVGSGLGKQTTEIVKAGFAGGEHGGSVVMTSRLEEESGG
jgi:hypothetical protein